MSWQNHPSQNNTQLWTETQLCSFACRFLSVSLAGVFEYSHHVCMDRPLKHSGANDHPISLPTSGDLECRSAPIHENLRNKWSPFRQICLCIVCTDLGGWSLCWWWPSSCQQECNYLHPTSSEAVKPTCTQWCFSDRCPLSAQGEIGAVREGSVRVCTQRSYRPHWLLSCMGNRAWYPDPFSLLCEGFK